MLGGIFFSCGIFDSKSDEITKLYVTLQQLDQVAIYDTPELVLLKIIDIDFTGVNITDTPHYIVLDEDHGFWFVSTIESDYIAQYSLKTDNLIDTIHVGNNPALMTIDPASNTLFCSRMNMADMPGMGGMGGMGMSQTNIINEITYNENGLSSGREFILDSQVLHGITYDDNKNNIFTASITDDWLYKIHLATDSTTSVSLDSSFTNHIQNYPNRLQPLQIITLNDSIIAISCSGFQDGINGQVQIWNSERMIYKTSYEFNNQSIPWHLIQSPNSNDLFLVLGGSNGNGGVACLTYSNNNNEIQLKWENLQDDFMGLHGITVDKAGEYIYVSGRGTHYLYQFDADTGDLLASIPLGNISLPGGISMMQNTCINCE